LRHQGPRKIAIVLAPLLVASMLVVLGGSQAAAAKPKQPKPRFTPAAGATFNNPYGGTAARRAIMRKLLRTIDSVPRGEEIRIASWNVRSHNIASALLRAKKRRVSVQIVMDRSNWMETNPNPDAARLYRELKKGNKHRRLERRSWLRQCRGACRGPHGIAHTKFFLFSKAGEAENVVIYGSNNATELAADIQWNDIFTRVNKPDEYAEFLSVFNEMAVGRKPKGGGYRVWNHGSFTSVFYPYAGKAAPKGDPAMDALSRIRCKGATTPGSRGRTKIRIAQTAMYGERGIAIAHRLAQMKRRGCDIRIVYAMFGNEVLRILRREAGPGGIPLTHLAWDRNEDGIYDRYVHMKTMAVRGVFDGNTNASLTINGSANWTPVALASDEVIGVLTQSKTTRTYIRWIDFLFTHRPASWGKESIGVASGVDDAVEGGMERRAGSTAPDPYALIKKEM
jgi:phosphatidylserine/phosphatidylglycerophosphate/cardiolipin synthase-like enzyme